MAFGSESTYIERWHSEQATALVNRTKAAFHCTTHAHDHSCPYFLTKDIKRFIDTLYHHHWPALGGQNRKHKAMISATFSSDQTPSGQRPTIAATSLTPRSPKAPFIYGDRRCLDADTSATFHSPHRCSSRTWLGRGLSLELRPPSSGGPPDAAAAPPSRHASAPQKRRGRRSTPPSADPSPRAATACDPQPRPSR